MSNIVMEFLWAMLITIAVWVLIYFVNEPQVAVSRAADSESTSTYNTAKNTPAVSAVEQLAQHTVSIGDVRRTYLVHQPTGYQPNKTWPLVLSFHSLYSSAELQAKQTKFNLAADRHGFLVVYPQGWHGSFNVGGCCGRAAVEKIDEFAFVRAMLAELKSKYSINPACVYAVGIGNGGSLCYQLGREMASEFAAICSVNGDMSEAGSNPTRPVPVLHIHGSADPLVPFSGGVGPTDFQKRTYRPIVDVLAQWRAWNHCQEVADETKDETLYTYTHFAPTAGTSGAEIVLYQIKRGGHCWPGGTQLLPSAIFGTQVDAIDASEVIWKFFASHSSTLPSPLANP